MVKKPSVSPTSDRRRISIRMRVILIVSMLLVVGYHLTVRAIDARFEAAWTSSQDDQPLDIESYIPPPELPAGVINATDFIQAAVLLAGGQKHAAKPRGSGAPGDLAGVFRRFRVLEVGREQPTVQDLETFRTAVDRYALALEVLDRGLDTATGARYAADYSALPFQVAVPNLITRLQLTALYRARAAVAVAEGRAADAWRDAVRLFQLAHWTAVDMPTLISALVARAMVHHGALLTQSLLSEAPATPEARAPVADWADRADVVQTMNRALGGERAMSFDQIHNPTTQWDDLGGVDPGFGGTVQRWLFGWRPWRRLNAALYLEAASPRFASCAKPSYQRRGQARDEPPPLPSSWALPALHQFFDCADVANKRDLWLAEQRQILLALELEAVRERSGDEPETLDAAASDPFSGASLRYRKEAQGYTLYSISVNGRDDGGLPPPAGDHGFPDLGERDLVWRVDRSSGTEAR